jgi:hypothetical protein
MGTDKQLGLSFNKNIDAQGSRDWGNLLYYEAIARRWRVSFRGTVAFHSGALCATAIGVQGNLGAGKSSVFKMIESAFQELFMLENEQIRLREE